MIEADYQFHRNMLLVPQVGYCSSTDKQWKRTEKRRMEEDKQLEKRRQIAEEHERTFLSVSSMEVSSDFVDVNIDEESDKEFSDSEESIKYAFSSSLLDHEDDDMPPQYRHIRHGPRSVRPEYYVTMHKLKSKLHLSENQAQGAICTVANNLFGRKEYGAWKRYERDKPTTYNTLPAINNTNRTEAYVEALILAGITNEIMSSEMETVVTYSNDGSALSGVGNYIVQSFSINGKQRALPTLNIFTETRASLKELQLMTYKILAASSGWKYTEKDLVEKIDFVMTDSTAHNIGVIQDVCDELETDSIPDSLICHIHPMMMFQRKVKAVWQEIHDAFGTNSIKDCFITDVDFRNESFICKALACLSSFINKDFSSKPWNRQEHFDAFISPHKNESLSLKDHRFNRIFECCLRVLHHLDDIKLYLDTYQNILNGVAILDRTFLDMELLKPIFCATALIGIHFTSPYLSLLLDTKTTYETLITSFPIIYQDLSNVNTELMLQTEQRVINFIDDEKFKRSLPNNSLRESVSQCAIQYKKEVRYHFYLGHCIFSMLYM